MIQNTKNTKHTTRILQENYFKENTNNTTKNTTRILQTIQQKYYKNNQNTKILENTT